jgi:hypothetical protein
MLLKKPDLDECSLISPMKELKTDRSTCLTGGDDSKQSELISIHVFDENRKVDKIFRCEKHLLLKYMKYFTKYLSQQLTNQDIDISVHCDIKIFEWLVKYLRAIDSQPPSQLFAARHHQYRKKTEEERQKEKETDQANQFQPILDLKNVISILISSDFL